MDNLQYLIDKIRESDILGKHIITFEELKTWFREKAIRLREQPYLTASLRQWMKENNTRTVLRFSIYFDKHATPPIERNHTYYKLIYNLYPEFAYLENVYDVIDVMEKAIDQAYQSYDERAKTTITDWAWWYISQTFYRKLANRKYQEEIYEIDAIYEPSADATDFKGSSALTIFMKQMGRYPLLSAEEEKQLAWIIYTYQTELKKKQIQEKLARQDNLSDEERQFLEDHKPLIVNEILLEKLAPQAQEARNRFITSNLRLVVSIAKHFTSYQAPLEDLIEEGILGLMKAIDNFDPTMGNKFSTYATWWIKQHINRYIANTKEQIRIPVHMQEAIKKYQKAYKELLEASGTPPTDSDLAKHLNMTVEKVRDIKKLIQQQYISIDRTVASMAYEVPDNHSWSNPEEYVLKQDLKRHISAILSKLPERNREILTMHFGIEDYPPMSLSEIGNIFGLSRERVRQIINASVRKIKYKSYLEKLRKVAPFYTHVATINRKIYYPQRYRPKYTPQKHPVYTELHPPRQQQKYFLIIQPTSSEEQTQIHPRVKIPHTIRPTGPSSPIMKITIPTLRVKRALLQILRKMHTRDKSDL